MITMPLPHVNGYDVIEMVGIGSFSTVYKASTKVTPKEIVAVKCIDKRYQKKSFADNVVKEISLLKILKHEYIVRLIDFMWDTKYIFIITEYCDEGDLSQYIRKKHKLVEPLVKTFMQQLAMALKFLHSHSICHMDLKPQNLLLSSKPSLKLKVADFGLSQILSTDNVEQSRYAGSLLYMAPEKLLEQEFDARVDLWSVGVILYECLFGRPPFLNLNTKNIVDIVYKQAPIELPPNVCISNNCENLLFGLLKYDPSKRISFEEFFNHEFIDLIHIPTPENYLAAVKLVEEAIELDKTKQYTSSLPKYKKAVTYLDAFIAIETDVNKKALLNMRQQDYIKWINALEDLINGKKLSRQSISQPLPRLSGSQYELLRDLATVTPNIATGLDIGTTGEFYLAEGKKELALEKFRSALSILIPLLSKEPAGPRKEMLHTQVKKWLAIAESLKRQCEDI